MNENDSKTITLSAKLPLDIGDWFVVEATIAPTERYKRRDMGWVFAIDKRGRQVFSPEATEGGQATGFDVRTLLNVGDTLYIEAKNGGRLYESLHKQGINPDACTIGAFWQVQEDGSLLCTGT